MVLYSKDSNLRFGLVFASQSWGHTLCLPSALAFFSVPGRHELKGPPFRPCTKTMSASIPHSLPTRPLLQLSTSLRWCSAPGTRRCTPSLTSRHLPEPEGLDLEFSSALSALLRILQLAEPDSLCSQPSYVEDPISSLYLPWTERIASSRDRAPSVPVDNWTASPPASPACCWALVILCSIPRAPDFRNHS